MSYYENTRQYIIQRYAPHVPADVKRGTRVYSPWRKKYGRVTSFQFDFGRVYARLDGEKHSGIFHPTDLEYNVTEPGAGAAGERESLA